MKETSLYRRPDIVCSRWFAMKRFDYKVLIFAKDKHDRPLGPYVLDFLDTDQQLGITDGGLVILIPIENLLLQVPADCCQEFVALLRTPRYLRKPDNYIHPDDSPELRRLLSRDKRK